MQGGECSNQPVSCSAYKYLFLQRDCDGEGFIQAAHSVAILQLMKFRAGASGEL